jgi:hypothetical protein
MHRIPGLLKIATDEKTSYYSSNSPQELAYGWRMISPIYQYETTI